LSFENYLREQEQLLNMSRGLFRILIILLLIYLVAGVTINLTVGNKTIDNLRENPVLIFETPFNYILKMFNKKI